MLSAPSTDKKKSSGGAGQEGLPNGNWIACVAWVMYGMFLNPSASSRSERDPVAARAVPCQWAGQPLGHSAQRNQVLREPMKWNLEVEPFFKFLRLIR